MLKILKFCLANQCHGRRYNTRLFYLRLLPRPTKCCWFGDVTEIISPEAFYLHQKTFVHLPQKLLFTGMRFWCKTQPWNRAKCDKKWLLVWIRGFWIAVDWEFGRLRAVFQGTVHIYLVWCSNHIRLQFCESGLFSAVLLMFDFWWYSGFFSMFLNINLSDQLRRINKFLLCVCVLHVL